MALSQNTLNELRAHVNAEMAAAPVPAAAAGGGLPLPGDFCKVWAQIRPILKLIASLPIPIPGLGAGLTALMTIGDALCPGS